MSPACAGRTTAPPGHPSKGEAALLEAGVGAAASAAGGKAADRDLQAWLPVPRPAGQGAGVGEVRMLLPLARAQ